MIPTTPNTWLNPPVSGPLSRQLRALRMTVGPRAVQSKNAATSLLEREKAWDARQQTLSHMPLKVVDSCTTRSASHARTWIHFRHILCTNIITMTLAINKVTIYRHYKNAHTQMRKSWRVETESKREKKVGIKEN